MKRCARSCAVWNSGWKPPGLTPAAADRKERDAREERDGVKNVISGYALRLDSRKKKAERAKDRHVKLQMEENAPRLPDQDAL